MISIYIFFGLPLKWISVYLLRTCISVSKFQFTHKIFGLPLFHFTCVNFGLPDIQFTHENSGLPEISIYSSRFRFTLNLCLLENSVYLQFLFTTKHFSAELLSNMGTRTHFRGATDLRKVDLPQILISVYLLCDMIFCKQISVYPQFQLTLWNFRFTAISWDLPVCKFRLTCNFSLQMLFFKIYREFRKN